MDIATSAQTPLPQAAGTMLEALLTAHRQLEEAASLTSAARFGEAAATCSEVARGLHCKSQAIERWQLWETVET